MAEAEKMKDPSEQVGSLYDEFRTVELNKEYYSTRIESTRKKLRALDIFLAIFAAGSGVIGLGFWKSELLGIQIGQFALGACVASATILAIAKPYMRWEDELERLSSVQSAYSFMSHALYNIVQKIKANRSFSDTDEVVFYTIRDIRGSLSSKEDAIAVKKIVDEMESVVEKRYPVEYFWWPESNTMK